MNALWDSIVMLLGIIAIFIGLSWLQGCADSPDWTTHTQLGSTVRAWDGAPCALDQIEKLQAEWARETDDKGWARYLTIDCVEEIPGANTEEDWGCRDVGGPRILFESSDCIPDTALTHGFAHVWSCWETGDADAAHQRTEWVYVGRVNTAARLLFPGACG